MSVKDLIPKDLSKRPDHKELSAKGGRSRSEAKRLANKINGLKHASPEKQAEFYNKMRTDPQYSSDFILKNIEDVNYHGFRSALNPWRLEGA